jgi:hypothetical protein
MTITQLCAHIVYIKSRQHNVYTTDHQSSFLIKIIKNNDMHWRGTLSRGEAIVIGVADTDMLATAYTSIGYLDGVNFRHVVQPGEQHNETYWAERFPGAMQCVLGPRN